MATESYYMGPSPARSSYLNGTRILQICRQAKVEAVHPGYGFLSENADFAMECRDNGIQFIGPPVEAIVSMGSKSASKEIMIAAGIPVLHGYHGDDQSDSRLQIEADSMGYPILIKAVLGGGGKGMRIVTNRNEFPEALEACRREAQSFFKDSRVLLEKYLNNPRHIEYQIFADNYGQIVHLFERDCSIQRRHQKVIEEAPAINVIESLRQKMGEAAIHAAKAVGYIGAGTVEFLLDQDKFYFMEMNTRLQVEHPITEYITNQDLVEWQLRVASGEKLPLNQEELEIHGHAIEARIYAESPSKGFLPQSGTLHHVRLPPVSRRVRVDTGFEQNDEISVFYDSMIAKLVVHGENRRDAINRLRRALKQYQIVGLPTNHELALRICSDPAFVSGQFDTGFLEKHGKHILLAPHILSPSMQAIGTVCFLLMTQAQRRRKKESTDPWESPSLRYFRSSGTYIRVLSVDGNAVTAECIAHDTFRVHTAEATDAFDVCGTLSSSGEFSLKVDERQYKGTAVLHSRQLHVFCEDDFKQYVDVFQIETPKSAAFACKEKSTVANEKILTPMPGKVIQVYVKKGDTVALGQPLVVIEAMKMEHVIKATRSAEVETISCQEGDFVSDGHILLNLRIG
uniref:MethylcrotonoylCoA carboxylase subunit alpha putativ n=1 Tax=Albugo laibachii Nc14 TaxID=890382 RepID=F0X0N8_9STRA|nr:methylcrotonoylCoA carboxylase subunit alpha putativ [Albugo laibachii Nc14]|eukprot:CCA27331.1 methylcrotonoylCoA carboxylase subunit alpha putativ [Albugo laibachii Nc14]